MVWACSVGIDAEVQASYVHELCDRRGITSGGNRSLPTRGTA